MGMLARMTAGTGGATIDRAVRLAARPSVLRNSQPLRWQADRGLLDLYRVGERLLRLLRAGPADPTPVTPREFAFDDMNGHSRRRTRYSTMS
ncbi:hypothetical protein [Nocardia carnea]|uniref:hypothetical protein n=1 Tax=Nocardia carnea TaxID=37328 RepID=UPI00245558D9|nr:hypothetical protein [Nocardia carnea]